MRTAMLLTTLSLMLAPGLVMAQCNAGKTQQQAMTCIPGTSWDAETGTCVPVVNS